MGTSPTGHRPGSRTPPSVARALHKTEKIRGGAPGETLSHSPEALSRLNTANPANTLSHQEPTPNEAG